MNWTALDTWIVVAGVLCAMSCALVGNFLVLRRMSMMGDAISHAVLPGLAVAFLLTGSRHGWAMFVGAAVVGVCTALFTQWVHTLGQVEESASMGVVFTVLFAVGLVLIVRAADKVDLDPGCVLYGAIEMVPLDTTRVLGFAIPRAVSMLGGILAFNLLFVALLYKELRIAAFDPALATTLGVNARLIHYLLMTLVAVTAVASFEAVGSILVIAMLVVPPATAHLLTDRYGVMLGLSMVIAAAGAVLGHVGAITVPAWFGYSDTSTAGMMAVAVGTLFALAMLLAPRYGLISRAYHRLSLSLRIVCEDILGALYRQEEWQQGAPKVAVATLPSRVPGSKLAVRIGAWWLRGRGFLAIFEGQLMLTPAGRERAVQLIRGHRLWESYLAKHLELPSDHLHDSAEWAEHYLTDTMRRAIAADVDHAPRDPHGKEIP